jgi:hypothetical protein
MPASFCTVQGDGHSPARSVHPSGPAPKVRSSMYEAAEDMARAIDVWLEDATNKAEESSIAAQDANWKFVPFRKAEGKAV